MTAACVAPATIVAGCGSCPATPPTIYRAFPCDQGCSNLGPCKTVYEIVTASDLCECGPIFLVGVGTVGWVLNDFWGRRCEPDDSSDDNDAEWPDHCEPGHDDDHGGRIRQPGSGQHGG